jgi:hypothetical protein
MPTPTTKHRPCVDCGESDLRVLDFDHRDPAAKRENVGTLLTKPVSWRQILEEIEECDVRCANCHRRRTAEMNGWFRQRAQLARVEQSRTAATARMAAVLPPEARQDDQPVTARALVEPGVWSLSIRSWRAA